VRSDYAQTERGIDWLGAVLATAGLGLIALALTGAEHGEVFDNRSLSLACLGAVVLAAFIWVENKSRFPMMPLALFANRDFTAVNIISFLIYFAFSAILFYLPMAVIGGWGVTEIEAAAAYAPLSVFIAGLSGLAGKYSSRFGPAPFLIAGSLVLSVGYAALALVVPTQNFWGGVIPAMCFQGVGMGLIVAPLSNAVMSSVPQNSTGTASGINNAFTRMAGLIAVAAMGSVVAIYYATAGGDGSFGALLDTQAHKAASSAAFIKVAWVASGCTALSAIVAMFMQARLKRS
jgi:MFS family permease